MQTGHTVTSRKSDFILEITKNTIKVKTKIQQLDWMRPVGVKVGGSSTGHAHSLLNVEVIRHICKSQTEQQHIPHITLVAVTCKPQ